MNNRCINIDWLEVFCNESGSAKDAAYFERLGYQVERRAYGTPQYAEMFTILRQGLGYFEVRRAPYSLRCNGGIFLSGDCHIRLCNRTCYYEKPIDELRKFLIAHNYSYKSLSRIDICLDFNRFDLNDKPENVMLDYMRGAISKINQCNIAAHGKDSFNGRVWNSVSWGSDNSAVRTKLYCKSLEMKETREKTYIIDQWVAAGLDVTQNVWRVEFSIKSDLKHFVKLDDGELIKHDLTCYDTRDKCLFFFHSLCYRYFHFKKIVKTERGTIQRKDRCPDKILFRTSADESSYKPVRLKTRSDLTRTDRILINRLYAIYNDYSNKSEIRLSAHNLIVMLSEGLHIYNLPKIWNDLILTSEE